MDWLTHVLPTAAAFLDQHGLLSAFMLLLLEEAGVPLPVPGDASCFWSACACIRHT